MTIGTDREASFMLQQLYILSDSFRFFSESCFNLSVLFLLVLTQMRLTFAH